MTVAAECLFVDSWEVAVSARESKKSQHFCSLMTKVLLAMLWPSPENPGVSEKSQMQRPSWPSDEPQSSGRTRQPALLVDRYVQSTPRKYAKTKQQQFTLQPQIWAGKGALSFCRNALAVSKVQWICTFYIPRLQWNLYQWELTLGKNGRISLSLLPFRYSLTGLNRTENPLHFSREGQ